MKTIIDSHYYGTQSIQDLELQLGDAYVFFKLGGSASEVSDIGY